MKAVYAAYAAVSATTFAAYALAVSAASAPPSVHAAGLVLWLAHVVLIFGRAPASRRADTREPGALGRREALDRAAERAVGVFTGEGGLTTTSGDAAPRAALRDRPAEGPKR